MTTLTIGHLNVHNRARAVRYMLAQNCDSLGLNEANSLLGMLSARRRYRVVVGSGGRDKRRGASEVPVLTRRELPSLGSIALQVSEQAAPERIAPDRWVTVSAFAHNVGHVAHVNVHPNAVTDNLTESVPRVRETAELWASVDRLLTFLRAEGFLIVLSGDLNSRRSGETPDYEGAYDVIDRHKLNVITEGLDCIAHDRRLRRLRHEIVERRRTGSDHPGLVAELGRVR